MTDRTRFFDSQEGQVIIKANYPRLAKPLAIDEFRLAFGKFKNIICGKEGGDPSRLADFNAYSDFIDSLHMQFGGTNFYQYHNAFSMKMEQYEAAGHPVDWSLKDTESYLKVFASVKSNAYIHCGSCLHLTKFCPNPIAPQRAQNQSRPWSTNDNHTWTPECQNKPNAYADSQSYQTPRPPPHATRQAQHFNGKEICRNFNNKNKKCRHDHQDFMKIVHVCDKCHSSTHPGYRCPNNPYWLAKSPNNTNLILKASTPINISELQKQMSDHPDQTFANTLVRGLNMVSILDSVVYQQKISYAKITIQLQTTRKSSLNT